MLSSTVLMQLERLGAHIPADLMPSQLFGETSVGPFRVPAVIQALSMVRWPPGQVQRMHQKPHWEVHLGALFTVGKLVREPANRPWYAVGHDQAQYFYVVDLEAAASTLDPVLYRVDHEGVDAIGHGESLSGILSTLQSCTS
ncbi:hypothetical protein [Streptomyces bobili]|uniref:hypothetical protein n=1 Tax=Streptomyces bobili TaxID=67280 RepID=UPI00382DE757